MNKEQLKEAVGELNLVDTVFEYDGVSYIDTAVSVMQVYDLIDQLDEPKITLNEAFNKLEETHILSKEEIVKHFEQLEIHNSKVTYGDYETLSQKWIDEHRKSYTMEDSVEISDLQNLLVPKREELESKIKVLIEAYKQEEDAYGELENGWISGFIKDLKNLVEEEQKYYVSERDEEYGGFWFLSKNDNGDISIGVNRDWSEVDWDRLKLTEQEIKDYDERYWPFAERVEQADFRLSF